VWQTFGYVSEFLPNPPITRNQVELMQLDNVAAADAPGFGTLQIMATALEDILPQMVRQM
jgi:NADH dehydrogenase